jgi:hypothetical protein
MARPKKQTLHDLDLPLALIPMAQHFAVKDSGRPVLTGVGINSDPDGESYAMAADGFCGVMADLPEYREIERAGSPEKFTGNIIIPRAAIIAMSRIGNKAAPLSIRRETDRWFIGQYPAKVTVGTRSIAVGEVWMTFKPIEGTMNFRGVFTDAVTKSEDEERAGRLVNLSPDLMGKAVAIAKAMDPYSPVYGNPLKVTVSKPTDAVTITTKGPAGVALTILVMPLAVGA